MKKRLTIYSVKLRKSKVHGTGVFATKDFKKGELIGILSGTIPETYDEHCYHTCIFDVETEDGQRHTLAIEPTAPFKYLNHSDNPNAAMGTPAIIALRLVKKGKEITISYGDSWERKN